MSECRDPKSSILKTVRERGTGVLAGPVVLDHRGAAQGLAGDAGVPGWVGGACPTSMIVGSGISMQQGTGQAF